MQPHVREDSLTDWLLFYLSVNLDWVKYYAFNRHEESLNGFDWEWWVLTNNHAYRFTVQAKKLNNHGDNWSLINYGNRNGTQIDLLLESAKKNNAFPLYAFYSVSNPDIESRTMYKSELIHKMLDWYQSCKNGCFISPAFLVYEKVFKGFKFHIHSNWLVSISVPMP